MSLRANNKYMYMNKGAFKHLIAFSKIAVAELLKARTKISHEEVSKSLLTTNKPIVKNWLNEIAINGIWRNKSRWILKKICEWWTSHSTNCKYTYINLESVFLCMKWNEIDHRMASPVHPWSWIRGIKCIGKINLQWV